MKKKTEKKLQKDRLLQLYYFATPLFFIVEHLLGFNLRVSLPASLSALEPIYYVVCFLGAFLFFKHKLAAALFSLAECSINILMLLLSVFLPVVTIGALDAPTFKFGAPELLHFMIAGLFLVIAFHRNPLIDAQAES